MERFGIEEIGGLVRMEESESQISHCKPSLTLSVNVQI